MDKNQFDLFIKPHHSWLTINWKEIWRYRDLVMLFVKRNLTVQYKQTILGPLWLIINPLFTSIMFTIIFGGFAKLPTDNVPQLLFYFCGNTIWVLFANCLTSISNTFINDGYIMSKVYFPRLVMPLSRVITSILGFVIQFLILLCFFFIYFAKGLVPFFSANILLVIPLVLQCALLGLGIGIMISSMTTKYRDLAYLVGFGVQMWLYATPIAYPLSTAGGLMKTVLLINPMTAVVENFRYAILGSGTFLLSNWILSLGITFFLFFTGIILFNKVEKNFSDTI